MHVLITGAGGHLGRKLFDTLEADPIYEVSGIDIREVDHPRIHTADISEGDAWATHLEGVDVVVHLAGDREPTATWPSAIKNNMDATLSLYHHASAHRVKRVVLASSNWIHGDKRFTRDRLTPDTPPGPINAYGMSKLFCERTGEYFAKHHGISVLCMRIGWTQWTHNNRPGRHMEMGRWGQEMWLSDRDFLNGMMAAISVEGLNFAVLNLMSDNPRMRWDISETKALIGYAPEDGSAAVVGPLIVFRSALKRFTTYTIPRGFNWLFPTW